MNPYALFFNAAPGFLSEICMTGTPNALLFHKLIDFLVAKKRRKEVLIIFANY